MVNAMCEINVTITHPHGVPIPFKESLVFFLLQRPNLLAAFSTGDWLRTLTNAQLAALIKGLTELRDGASGIGYHDLLRVLIRCATTESKDDVSKLSRDHVPALVAKFLHIASLEVSRRYGFVQFNGPLRIFSSADDTFTVTEEGMKQSELLKTPH